MVVTPVLGDPRQEKQAFKAILGHMAWSVNYITSIEFSKEYKASYAHHSCPCTLWPRATVHRMQGGAQRQKPA